MRTYFTRPNRGSDTFSKNFFSWTKVSSSLSDVYSYLVFREIKDFERMYIPLAGHVYITETGELRVAEDNGSEPRDPPENYRGKSTSDSSLLTVHPGH